MGEIVIKMPELEKNEVFDIPNLSETNAIHLLKDMKIIKKAIQAKGLMKFFDENDGMLKNLTVEEEDLYMQGDSG